MAFALANHRFGSKNHAGLQNQVLALAAVVQDLQGSVKAMSDAVAVRFLYDGIACVFGNLLVGVASITEYGTRFDGGDVCHHGFVGNVN